MLNILKMDLYRMIKSKAAWIILAASILMMFASVFMTKQDIDYYNNNPVAFENLENGGDISWGIYIGSVNPKWCNGNIIPLIELLAVNIKSKMLLMFLTVFIVYFAGSEGRNSFMKNIVGQVKNRAFLVMSKFITISIYTVLVIIGAMFATMLGSRMFFGYMSFAGMSQGIIFLLIQILLHIGYGMFVLLLYHITRSSVATMLSGILIAAGILQFIDAILLAVFTHLKSAAGFSILNYTTSGNVGTLPLSGNETIYMRAGIVAVCAIVLMNILSSTIIQRRDLR